MTLPTSVSASITTSPGPNTASARPRREPGAAGTGGMGGERSRIREVAWYSQADARGKLALRDAPTENRAMSESLTHPAPHPGLRLHNSLSRRREAFVPADPSHVRMYVCGPTVYDRAHLGNARPVVVFDVLARLLRRLYPRLTYVRNITDVDDKINARAAESGEPIEQITARTAADFHRDMAALGALPPDEEPRATQHIAGIIRIIERLIASGHAYAAEGHVLFSVPDFPPYGKLSGRSP